MIDRKPTRRSLVTAALSAAWPRARLLRTPRRPAFVRQRRFLRPAAFPKCSWNDPETTSESRYGQWAAPNVGSGRHARSPARQILCPIVHQHAPALEQVRAALS